MESIIFIIVLIAGFCDATTEIAKSRGNKK